MCSILHCFSFVLGFVLELFFCPTPEAWLLKTHKTMVSAWDHGILLEVCNKFIKYSEDINLSHLLNAVHTLILDQDSNDFKNWSKHMEVLNETWMLINIENQLVNWPKVCYGLLMTFDMRISHLNAVICSPRPPTLNLLQSWVSRQLSTMPASTAKLPKINRISFGLHSSFSWMVEMALVQLSHPRQQNSGRRGGRSAMS